MKQESCAPEFWLQPVQPPPMQQRRKPQRHRKAEHAVCEVCWRVWRNARPHRRRRAPPRARTHVHSHRPPLPPRAVSARGWSRNSMHEVEACRNRCATALRHPLRRSRAEAAGPRRRHRKRRERDGADRRRHHRRRQCQNHESDASVYVRGSARPRVVRSRARRASDVSKRPGRVPGPVRSL
jgi:hypothetical protein